MDESRQIALQKTFMSAMIFYFFYWQGLFREFYVQMSIAFIESSRFYLIRAVNTFLMTYVIIIFAYRLEFDTGFFRVE